MPVFVSTSNGVFSVNPDTETVRCVLTCKHKPGLFNKKAKGYFGVCKYPGNKVIVASKEVLVTPRENKPTSDCILHLISPEAEEYRQIGVVYDAHDVHQIEYYNGVIFVTDTGKNRVVVYDIEKQSVIGYLNIGVRRFDFNHINVVKVIDGALHIGLNYAEPNSKILRLNLYMLEEAMRCPDVTVMVDILDVPGYLHTHDLAECDSKMLVCSSLEGKLIDVNSGDVLWRHEPWLRGIAITEQHVWVGQSVHAKRRKRHSRKLPGYLHQLDRKSYRLQKTIKLSNVGQINDMTYSAEQY